MIRALRCLREAPISRDDPAHAHHRSHRQARAGRRRRRRRRLRLRDRQGAGRGRRDGLRRHLAAGARHLQDPARARQVRRVARRCATAASWRSRRSIRSTPSSTRSRTCPPSCARTGATATSATSRSAGSRPRSRPTSATAALDIVVHSLANGPEVKKPLLETIAQGLPRRGLGVGVLDRLDGAATSAR